MMKLIDVQYMKTPVDAGLFKQARMQSEPEAGTARLMWLMGLEAIYPKPKTRIPHQEHRIYPYLLKGLEINRPDMVWVADITFIPLRHGFMYLVAVMGLVQQKNAFLAHIRHTRFRFLCIRFAGGDRMLRLSRYIQHRPVQPVHKHGFYERFKIARHQDQHELTWPVHRQHLRGKALVDGEVSLSSPSFF